MRNAICAVIDWHSRYVSSWRLSITLQSDFCIEALQGAIAAYGKPDIFNTDQGVQFTSNHFIQVLQEHGILISMDGKGRALYQFEEILVNSPGDIFSINGASKILHTCSCSRFLHLVSVKKSLPYIIH